MEDSGAAAESNPPPLDAALIAGGKSSRFGGDKAFAEWRGGPLYAHQLRTLARLEPGTLYLSTRRGQPFPDVIAGVERIDDPVEGEGPAVALQTILAASEAERVVVLAVDLPLVSVSFLGDLVSGFDGGVVPVHEGRWEPLVAVYPRREMLGLIESSLAEGERKLQRILDRAELAGVIERRPVSEREERLLANVNTGADLEAIARGRFDEAVTLDRYRVDSGFDGEVPDYVAAEEPLEIRVNDRSVAVVMRTPGHDDELAAGFLLTEGVVGLPDEILEIAHCPDVDPEAEGNVLDVRLRDAPDLDSLTRHVFTSSSCGVCGKATIDSVMGQFPPVERSWEASPGLLLSLPDKLRAAQKTFDRTGGLHASALFTQDGDLRLLREDVGRHNALDKVIGHSLLHRIPLDESILLVSGRISFELMQKSLAARIPVVAGISAPSSLAVRVARESGQTLVGFLRERGFNRYHAME